MEMVDGSMMFMSRFYRDYMPDLGRWMQAEKLGMTPNDLAVNPFRPLMQYRDGMNVYVAFKSNPIRFKDKLGLTAIPYFPTFPDYYLHPTPISRLEQEMLFAMPFYPACPKNRCDDCKCKVAILRLIESTWGHTDPAVQDCNGNWSYIMFQNSENVNAEWPDTVGPASVDPFFDFTNEKINKDFVVVTSSDFPCSLVPWAKSWMKNIEKALDNNFTYNMWTLNTCYDFTEYLYRNLSIKGGYWLHKCGLKYKDCNCGKDKK
jgi:hypothetical protein